MPSPFPGMDPWLEGSLWTTFHFSFGAEIIRAVAPRLRPRYLALPVERVLLSDPSDITLATSLYPAVGVVRTRVDAATESAVRTTNAPLQLATVIPEPVPHLSIEIRDTAQRQVVTVIEILSPTNKHGDGYAEYLDKRQRLLRSTTHLVEIDLLRAGRRVPMQQPLPSADYFAFVGRVSQRPLLDVWPILLTEPLPTITLPLLPGDPELPLDLQAVFTATYDLLGYDLAIDYAQPAHPLLSTDAARWAAAQLSTYHARQQ